MNNVVIPKEISQSIKGGYNDTDEMRSWLNFVHHGQKKNMASFLFFIDKYRDLLNCNPLSRIFFLGCGWSQWYEYIPVLFYDRQIVFIDKEINSKIMCKFPNVEIQRRYVYEVEDSFRDSIVIMDMSRSTDDFDLFQLMISISKVSLCFMYKLRSEWYRSSKIYGSDIFIPPFTYFGSSEARVFGSQSDSSMLSIDLDIKRKVSRLTKMRRIFSKCHDCYIFSDIVSKFIKLPSGWSFMTQRDVDIDIMYLSSLVPCKHDFSKINVYLDGCDFCIKNFYRDYGEFLCTWIGPGKNGPNFIGSHKKKKGLKYTNDVYLMVPGIKSLLKNSV